MSSLQIWRYLGTYGLTGFDSYQLIASKCWPEFPCSRSLSYLGHIVLMKVVYGFYIRACMHLVMCSSYLHCDWRTAEELLVGDKRILSKIKRYKLKRAQNPYLAEVTITILKLYYLLLHDCCSGSVIEFYSVWRSFFRPVVSMVIHQTLM